MISIYVTCKDEKEAVKISKHLLKKRLIACSNMFPIKSMYWWDKKVVNDNEIVILAKTSNENYEMSEIATRNLRTSTRSKKAISEHAQKPSVFDKIKKEVKKLHSYDVPCILKFNVEANKEYEEWVEKETK